LQARQHVRQPDYIEGLEKNIWIWNDANGQKIIPGNEYVMGVDVASGRGDDNSAIVVFNVVTGQQVMEYNGKITPDELASLIKPYGEFYNALTVIDSGGGWANSCMIELSKLEYKATIYRSQPKGKELADLYRVWSYVNEKVLKEGLDLTAFRSLILQEFDKQLRDEHIVIRSFRAISEMRNYVYSSAGRPDHKRGQHDDIIIAIAMALYVAEYSCKSLKKAIEHDKARLEAFGTSNNTMITNTDVNSSNDPEQRRWDTGIASDPDYFGTSTNYHQQQSDAKEYGWLFS
jgi:hypothetical protein